MTSSSVRSVGYDPDARVLEIQFQNGGVYQYLDVPAGEFHALMSADSVGTHMNSVIKRRYRFRHLSP